MSINTVCKAPGRWSVVWALFCAALFLAGCHSKSPHQVSPNQPGAAAGPSGIIDDSPDLIRVGDALEVIITDTPDKIPVFEDKVKDTGTITLMLNMTFAVTNKTRGDLEKEIREKYVPEYYKYMTVTVRHVGQSRFYYLGGEVKAPGRQVYIGRITVTKAIETVGDFTDFAKKTKVQLTRANGRTQIVNCKKAIKDPRLDPEVFPNDKIYVPRRLW